MTINQRIQRGAAAALMIASLGACAGNSLGNILGAFSAVEVRSRASSPAQCAA
jgi:hypothetical protein